MSTQYGGAVPVNEPVAPEPAMPAGPISTDPMALMEQIAALAADDQAQLQMQQQMQMQQLTEQQKSTLVQALQGLVSALGEGAHALGGAEAAVPPAGDYAGVAPGMPMDALAEGQAAIDAGVPGMEMAAGMPPGMPVISPDEIPPQFG